MTVRNLLALVAGGAALVAVVATAASATSQAITPPPAIKSAGKIVFCTDATYPPEEYFQGSKIVGSDIDIGTGVAKAMGVGAQFKNTGFDGIIAALLSKRCDAVISGMNDTPARRKQVDFVDYLKVGQSIMPGVVSPVRDLVAPPEHALDVDLTADGFGGPRRDACCGQHLCRPQQRLRGQTRVVGALTSRELALDDRDLRVLIELSQGADEVLATRAGAEHEHPSVCHQAERAGFEPATHLSARTRFPVALLRPLGHLSATATD